MGHMEWARVRNGRGDGGGTGLCANVFAINFIFICQESWIPGGLAAGRGGDHHRIWLGLSLVLAAVNGGDMAENAGV